MKYFFALLVLIIGASIVGVAHRPRPAASQPSAPEPARPWRPDAVARRAQAAEAGHVAEVLVWGSRPVAKGEVLVRLRVPVSTPELQRGQEALRRAAEAYRRQPTPANAQALAQARARLAAVPRYARNGYVVAPVAGWLRGTTVVSGQYLPKAGTVGLIEVPAPSGEAVEELAAN